MEHSDKPPRFYAPDLARAMAAPDGLPEPSGAAGRHVTLPPGEGHHAANVLRLRAGAAVELFDGCGTRALGHVEDLGRRRVVVLVDGPGGHLPRPRPLVHLAFAVPKGNRLDWLLEKATELGAASLRPVIFERSVAGAGGLSAAKRERWLGHCIAAAKQCGLDYLPAIKDPFPLPSFLTQGGDALSLLGDLEGGALSLVAALERRRAEEDVVILVGPEGGLTPKERTSARAAGFLPVRLGRTTLRIETAAIALLAGVRAIGG